MKAFFNGQNIPLFLDGSRCRLELSSASETPENFVALKALIDVANDGDTVDLNGLHYAPESVSELEIISASSGYFVVDGTFHSTSKNLTITNGKISGSLPLAWYDEGGGVYSATLPSSANAKLNKADFSENGFVFLVDESQTARPILQARKRNLDNDAKPWHAMARNQQWWTNRNDSVESRTDFTYTLSGTSTSSVTAHATVKADWDDLFDPLGVGGIIDVSSTTTAYWHSPNLVSTIQNDEYDTSTGTLTFATSTNNVSQYMAVVFTGFSNDLDLGEYCLAISENKIYYRPANGNPYSARLPFISTFLRLIGGNSQTVTMDNVLLQGFYDGTIAAGGVFTCSSFDDAAPTLSTTNDTTIRLSSSGPRGIRAAFEDSKFYEFITRATSSVSSGSITRCYFGNVANQSQLLFEWSSTSKPILISDSFFHLPASSHGQSISLYQDSWQNATVEHNVFFNATRVLSFQPASVGDASNIGTFEFSNNLVYVDGVFDVPVLAGQTGWSYNGATGTSLNNTAQKIVVKSNTFALSSSLWNNRTTNNTDQAVELTLDNAYYVETLVANNVLVNMRIPTSGDYAGSTLQSGLGSVNNGYYNDTATMLFEGFAENDILEQTYSNVFGSGVLTTTGSFATGATDGGVLGIRWSSVPTPSQISSLNDAKSLTWASTYTAESVPSPAFPTDPDLVIVEGDDKRP